MLRRTAQGRLAEVFGVDKGQDGFGEVNIAPDRIANGLAFFGYERMVHNEANLVRVADPVKTIVSRTPYRHVT